MISLFVINQAVPFDLLVAKMAAAQSDYLLVVTSHLVFPNEKQNLRSKVSKDITFRPMDSFFSEDDERAIEGQCLDQCGGSFPVFTDLFLHMRNEMVFNSVSEKHTIREIFYATGLGISDAVWKSNGSTALTVSSQSRSAKKKLSDRARLLWSRINSLALIKWQGRSIAFHGQTARIKERLASDVELIEPGVLRKSWIALTLLLGLRKEICVPLHQYAAFGNACVLIMQDGHLPSNYTKGLLLLYRESDVAVPSNPFAEKWYQTFDRKIQRLAFFRDPQFAVPVTPPHIRRVLVALNHAGDWTPMIHRSDTDRFALAALELAEAHPEIQFSLRPHPGMATVEHEGVNSFERLRNFVERSEPDNFTFSYADLDEELASCDVVISEYSQVLIDAWTKGLLGVSLNITHRESYLADYEDLGMPHAKSIEELAALLNGGSPKKIAEQQSQGVVNINNALSDWARKL